MSWLIKVWRWLSRPFRGTTYSVDRVNVLIEGELLEGARMDGGEWSIICKPAAWSCTKASQALDIYQEELETEVKRRLDAGEAMLDKAFKELEAKIREARKQKG